MIKKNEPECDTIVVGHPSPLDRHHGVPVPDKVLSGGAPQRQSYLYTGQEFKIGWHGMVLYRDIDLYA